MDKVVELVGGGFVINGAYPVQFHSKNTQHEAKLIMLAFWDQEGAIQTLDTTVLGLDTFSLGHDRTTKAQDKTLRGVMIPSLAGWSSWRGWSRWGRTLHRPPLLCDWSEWQLWLLLGEDHQDHLWIANPGWQKGLGVWNKKKSYIYTDIYNIKLC